MFWANNKEDFFALAAYGLVANQQRHKGVARDIGMQDVFSQLATITLPASESKTSIVDSFPTSSAAAAASLDLPALAQCNPKSFELVNRKLSISERVYLETINAKCTDGSTFQIVKNGFLPTDLARMLEVNASFLDIVSVSLAARDIASFVGGQLANPDDVFLVESDPWTALATCLANLAHPDAKWQYSRDVLLQHFPRSLQWFAPGWRPSTEGRLGASDEIALRKPDDFAAQRANFFPEK